MEVRLLYSYESSKQPELDELGMKLVADEIRTMLANLQQAFADASLDVEHSESARRRADAGEAGAPEPPTSSAASD